MQPAKLTREEIKQMADIMSSAFLHHENMIQAIKKEHKRKKALNHLFRAMYYVINEYGYIFRIKKENKDIAYITYMNGNDNTQISLKRIIKTKGLREVILFIMYLSPRSLKHYINYFKTYNAHCYPLREDMIHLYSVGILSEYRSKGIMGEAMRDSFTYFFNKGINRIVLETSDQSNIPIYQKLGFRITEVIKKKSQTIYFFQLEKVTK